jgi:hypothetical protein
LSSSAYWGGTGTSTYFGNSVTVSLNENTDYYFTGLNYNNASTWGISVSGPGDVYTESTIPSNTSYTYIAISLSDNTIKAVSATADFRSLNKGTYLVYGISYPNTSTADNFIGKLLTEIQATDCAVASSNSIRLTVTDISTNITNNDADSKELILYPSPAGDIVYINSHLKFVKAEIINYSGQIVETILINGTAISLKNLPAGNYIIKLYDEAMKEYTSKLIKK